MAIIGEIVDISEDSLAILKNVFMQSSSPSLEVMEAICDETGLSVQHIKAWFDEFHQVKNEVDSLMNVFDSLISKTNSSMVPKKGDLRLCKKNGQCSKFNGSQWRTVCRVPNCKNEKQRKHLCQKHFIIGSKVLYFRQQKDKVSNVQDKPKFDAQIDKLLRKSGHLNI
jgi:hypothetical protein